MRNSVILIMIYVVFSAIYLGYSIYNNHRYIVKNKISKNIDLDKYEMLEIKHTQGLNSLLRKLWILIPTLLFFFSIVIFIILVPYNISFEILIYVVNFTGLVLIGSLIFYVIQVYRNEFVANYGEHTIKVVNKFASIELYIDNEIVDKSRHTFLMTLQLRGKCDDVFVFARMKTTFYIKAQFIFISKTVIL